MKGLDRAQAEAAPERIPRVTAASQRALRAFMRPRNGKQCQRTETTFQRCAKARHAEIATRRRVAARILWELRGVSVRAYS